jgi:hypothetical protein
VEIAIRRDEGQPPPSSQPSASNTAPAGTPRGEPTHGRPRGVGSGATLVGQTALLRCEISDTLSLGRIGVRSLARVR